MAVKINTAKNVKIYLKKLLTIPFIYTLQIWLCLQITEYT